MNCDPVSVESPLAWVRIYTFFVSRALEQQVYFFDLSDWMHLTCVFSSLIFLRLCISHAVLECN